VLLDAVSSRYLVCGVGTLEVGELWLPLLKFEQRSMADKIADYGFAFDVRDLGLGLMETSNVRTVRPHVKLLFFEDTWEDNHAFARRTMFSPRSWQSLKRDCGKSGRMK
jgi:hypothetical protein